MALHTPSNPSWGDQLSRWLLGLATIATAGELIESVRALHTPTLLVAGLPMVAVMAAVWVLRGRQQRQ